MSSSSRPRSGIERFGVLGYSGGGPYALACGFAIPARVSAVGVVAGFAPPELPNHLDGVGKTDRQLIPLCRRAPWIAGPALRMARRMAERKPERFADSFEHELSEPDRKAFADPVVRELLRATFLEAMRAGPAQNVLKHRTLPKLRQMMPLMVLPVVAGASLAFLNLAALIPAGLWVAACVGYGVWMAVGQRNPYGPLAGVFGDGHASRLVGRLLAAAPRLRETRGAGVMTGLQDNRAARPGSTFASAPTAGASWKRRCARSAPSTCRPMRRCGSSLPTMTSCRAREGWSMRVGGRASVRARLSALPGLQHLDRPQRLPRQQHRRFPCLHRR